MLTSRQKLLLLAKLLEIIRTGVACFIVSIFKILFKYTICVFLDDGSHPSYQGSFLAACTIFEAIWGVSPVGNTFIPGFNQGIVEDLQTAAHQATTSRDWSWPQEGGIPCHHCLPSNLSSVEVVFQRVDVQYAARECLMLTYTKWRTQETKAIFFIFGFN